MSTVGLWDEKAPSQEAFSVKVVCVDKHRERREARSDDDSAHGGSGCGSTTRFESVRAPLQSAACSERLQQRRDGLHEKLLQPSLLCSTAASSVDGGCSRVAGASTLNCGQVCHGGDQRGAPSANKQSRLKFICRCRVLYLLSA